MVEEAWEGAGGGGVVEGQLWWWFASKRLRLCVALLIYALRDVKSFSVGVLSVTVGPNAKINERMVRGRGGGGGGGWLVRWG